MQSIISRFLALFLFSGNWAQSYEELSKQTMYNRMVKTDYNVANYLSGLEITHCDYRELFNAHKANKKALFLLDPPYLQTEHSAYKADTYWQLKDYLDVLTLLDDTKYVLFTSGKKPDNRALRLDKPELWRQAAERRTKVRTKQSHK